ncbi:penicillin-binding protein activator [Cronobacter malonaticus]|uniref:penicillin-binding protein activator n=1 Tax=Cronobacter malonaticus TaxID=413503 RepID=UPI000CFC2D54|nr:penicillin-binding protein activator [Cronobacter malonaticus]EKY3232000.1 penicillin-binding protein activator [Cronobacter malonaticus]ELY4024480.1 penicillin-binding protein activator [Cronobacter malonaticus]ELY4126679.1 penicillin-binding protein activator [Cronobacter malonaticus]ELY4818182.1 penicillin-binding protein activator [Cronobacter malonaticus]MDI7685107.1 penicillin-binding protein activator [Cronobacter malonaticus]
MVPSKFSGSKAARCLPVLLAALFFAGCGTQTADQSTAHMQGEAKADSGFYLHQMEQSRDDSKTNWQLLAIRALLGEGKRERAITLYNELPQNLTDAQRREASLLEAQIKLAQQDYQGAAALLDKINAADLNDEQKARYWQAKIDASQGRPSLELLRALIAQEPLLQGPSKQKNIDATWQALSQMSADQAKALVINADENTLQGWLDLQRVWFDNRNDPKMLQAGVKDWQTRYPQNPGAKMLPSQLANLQNYKPASADKIALLLPLNGQAAVFGRAIQQGFEAAKNAGTSPVAAQSPAPVQADNAAQPEQSAQTQPTDGVASPAAAPVDDLAAQPDAQESAQPAQQPADAQPVAAAPANPAAEIKIYDTSSQSITQILAQAQQDGASLVVGPLLKESVDGVLKSGTPLNVLALNQPETVQNRPNVCYFALSPEDEAADAAAHIWQEGKRAPLLLVPYSALGDRVTKAFADRWAQLGGGTVLQQKFGSVNELKMNINGGTGIALTGSPVAASLPQQQSVTIGGLTIPAPPTDAQITAGTSGNVDAVYILATPSEIALIKPMIAMRAGSHSGATLYASSRSAQGGSGPDFRLEMEGLEFSDIPMLTGSNPALMQQALAAVNNDYSLARLYAMGVDAWSLANHFSQMRQVPGFQLSGNTGALSATQDCVINRKLTWLKYQQGQLVPAN